MALSLQHSLDIDRQRQNDERQTAAVSMHSKLIALPVKRSEPVLSLARDNDGNSLAGDVAVLEVSRGMRFIL